MIPENILEAAAARKIDVIGITDHNTAENVAAVRSAAELTGIRVIGGMEVTSLEEVHILALFDGEQELASFQAFIYAHLHGTNDPDAFGHQWVVGPDGGVIDVNPRLLIGATTLPIRDVVGSIHSYGGVAIAAHIDRQSFSIISQLGFIPSDLDLDGVELSPFYERNGFGAGDLAAASGGGPARPTVTFSDAHHLEDVGRAFTEAVMAEGSVAELRLALRGEEGRLILGGQ